MPKNIEGILPIICTPFLDDDRIDDESIQRQLDWVYQQQGSGFGLAMVSELLRLTTDERVKLTHRLVELNDDRGVVIVNVGAESTQQALFFGRHTQTAGCDAIMAIPPISSAMPEAALEDYFCTLADQIDLPLIVQDASGYVGQPIPTELLVRLLNRYGPEKILFKPEAAPLGPNLSKLRDATDGRARIFEGSGGISLVDGFRRGIVGTMPGTDLLDGIAVLWNALKKGDEQTIYRVFFPLCALISVQAQAGLDGFLAIEKYLLRQRGIFSTTKRRSPNTWDLDDETTREVDRLFAQLKYALSTT